MKDFKLVDLVAQRDAVRRHLRGANKAEIVAWLRARGTLTTQMIQGVEVFHFESVTGIRCGFFFTNDDFVFHADHSTFR